MTGLRFWIAVTLSAALHSIPFVVLALWVPFTAAELLLPEGNSDRDGFDVEAIALNPGAWRQGDKNTPGGDDLPLIIPEDLASEQKPMPVEPQPETPPPVPLPVLVSVTDPPKETPKTNAATTGTRGQPKVNGLPGASGGANMPIGTPSRGGRVGVPGGLKVLSEGPNNYPPEARRRELEGKPIVWMRISAEGDVVEAKLEKSCGHAILDRAAVEKARSMRFRPATRAGVPVETTQLRRIVYELLD
jgi:protein TonB